MNNITFISSPRFRQLHAIVSCVLAITYFSFRVELFEDEYEESHPNQVNGNFISVPTLNWETFDKDNACAAFVFDARLRGESFSMVTTEFPQEHYTYLQFHPVRDKSPPVNASLENILS